ncbi:MAG: metalloregulator ArsR/SmtB family transcription factor [Patescibacteria group bacterium]
MKCTTKKICPSCLSIVGENTRVKIIQKLMKKPYNVSDIAACFSLTQPTISHHLKSLEEIGMVFNKKVGREIYYSLNKKYPCKNCQIFKLPFKS